MKIKYLHNFLELLKRSESINHKVQKVCTKDTKVYIIVF